MSIQQPPAPSAESSLDEVVRLAGAPAAAPIPADVGEWLFDAYEGRRLAWLAERAKTLAKGTRVLEVGFDGEVHRRIFSHCQYSFFDLRAFLASARSKDHPNAYKIPVDARLFEVVVSSNVLEWALYPEPALGEMLRALVPGGRLWVAPPMLRLPEGTPPRAVSSLRYPWYAATFARHGLDISDCFEATGLLTELCTLCVEVGRALPAGVAADGGREKLRRLLVHDVPLALAHLEVTTPMESPRSSLILEARHATAAFTEPSPGLGSRTVVRAGKRPLRITYLISSILGITGGNMTLLHQVEALRQRGHSLTIVTRTPRPRWTAIHAKVIQVGASEAMAPSVPPSDVVVSTYFSNASELLSIEAPVKIYYAQGDQFVFENRDPFPDPVRENQRQALNELSRRSYLLPGTHFVANSNNLARAVERAHGKKAEAVLPVCTDQTIFRPLPKAAPGSRLRILVVGPDTLGGGAESLLFKGIGDIRGALEIVASRFANFTAVRVATTAPEIFRDFPCEYHVTPTDEMKTFLFGTADFLVYASHFDSCPRPPQEGMAAGAAVVCTDTDGAREYCVHEENCLLVPIQNPRAIAEAILRLVRDRALRARIVEGGLRTAAKFPREREWDELEALLYQYLEGVGALG
jgi:glycosyltransferase involved in cell wall biosynthesis/SAM-dependent methyltransferase